MWRIPRVAVWILLLPFVLTGLSAQVVLFTENFGAQTSGTTTAIATYTGYQNFGSLTFSGSGDIRGNQVSNYTDASGAGNVFLTNSGSSTFAISGINTLAYATGTLSLTFGAFKNTIASNMSELTLAYSTDGTNYTPLSIPTQPTGSGTSNWRSITLTSTDIPISSNVSLKWTNTGTSPQFRLDDISLSGTLAAVPEPSTYAAIVGAVVLGCAAWARRRRKR